MFLAFIGAFIGLLTLGAVGYAVYAAHRALKAPQKANEDILRAFKALEGDYEELAERVLSQLGRISRLKRDMLPLLSEGKTSEATSSLSVEEKNHATSPPMTRSRLLALSKQKRGGTYAEEQELTGDGGRGRSEWPISRWRRTDRGPSNGPGPFSGDPGFFRSISRFARKAARAFRPFAGIALGLIPGGSAAGRLVAAAQAAGRFRSQLEGIQEGFAPSEISRDGPEGFEEIEESTEDVMDEEEEMGDAEDDF